METQLLDIHTPEDALLDIEDCLNEHADDAADLMAEGLYWYAKDREEDPYLADVLTRLYWRPWKGNDGPRPGLPRSVYVSLCWHRCP